MPKRRKQQPAAAANRSPAAHTHLAALLGLAALIGIAYANSLSAGFVLDNRGLILENPQLRSASWNNVAAIFAHDYWHPVANNGLYRPLTTLTYLFNYSVLGNADRPLGYHVVNLVLHWGCAALVYALLLELGSRRQLAALAAALFAVHPLTTEAVTNIIGRSDILAALAILAGLLSHSRAARSGGAPRRRWLALLAAAAFCGVFAKENAAVLLPLLAVWEILCADDAAPGARWRRCAASFALVLAAVVARAGAGAWVFSKVWVTPPNALDNPLLEAGFWSGRATALRIAGEQIWQLLWPHSLSADYSYNQIPLAVWPPGGGEVAAWMTVAALITALLLSLRRRPRIAFLLAFFFIALAPTANLLVAIGSIRADRFLYLPLIGFAGALVLTAFALAKSERSRRWLAAVMAVAIAASSWQTARRNRDWATDLALWTSALAVAPASAKVQKAYASARRGHDDSDAGLDLAIAHAERALAIRPDYVEALLDLGGHHVERGKRRNAAGQHEAAAFEYERALLLLRRARALDQRAKRERAAALRARAWSRRSFADAGNVELYRNLGLAHIGLGQVESALTAYRYARRLDPWRVQTYLDISAFAAMLGRWDDAAAALFAVIALDAKNSGAWRRLVELYGIVDPGGSSLAPEAGESRRVNLNDPLVLRHRCRANAELARIFTRARRPDVAATARRWIAANCAEIP